MPVRQRTFLDHNATSPLRESGRAAVLSALESGGNASSVHTEGRTARKLLETARAQLGSAVNAGANQIVFTSGATEAANHALSPLIRAGGREITVSRLYVSAIEHPCVLAGGRFAPEKVETLGVDEAGIIELDGLNASLAAHDHTTGAPMVAIMLANNETGVIQPIREISEIVHTYNGFLTVDAVQAFGRFPIDVAELGAHFVFVSSHKVGGPQGAGALIFGDASISPAVLLKGGGQENWQRGGTENVAAIAGFGAAAREAVSELSEKGSDSAIRDSIETGISTICGEAGNKAGDPVFFGAESRRLPNTSCFAVPGVKAETALISLDLAGIAVSSGSACSSGKVKKSHVLAAMGVEDDLAECALRVSAGHTTTNEDAERFLGAFKDIVNRVAA